MYCYCRQRLLSRSLSRIFRLVSSYRDYSRTCMYVCMYVHGTQRILSNSVTYICLLCTKTFRKSNNSIKTKRYFDFFFFFSFSFFVCLFFFFLVFFFFFFFFFFHLSFSLFSLKTDFKTSKSSSNLVIGCKRIGQRFI